MDLLNFAKQNPRNASRFEIQKLETAKGGTEVLQTEWNLFTVKFRKIET